MIDLREANPVPHHHVAGWSQTAEGLAARARAETAGPAGPPRRRARPALTVAVAAALVLALIASVLLLRSGRDSIAPAGRSVVERLAGGEWKTLDADPAKGIIDAATVWTGKELIVWGHRSGETWPSGASFDPRTRRWKTIDAPPLLGAARTGFTAVWTGLEMLIWGGAPASNEFGSSFPEITDYRDGGAYNPRTGAWRHVKDAPFPGTEIMSVTMAAHQMIVTRADAIYGYSPSSDTWEMLPSPPAPLSGNTFVRATRNSGGIVMLLRRESGPSIALAYDMTSRTWTELPPPPGAVTSAGADLVRSGRGVVLVNWYPGSRELGWARLDRDMWTGGAPVRHPSICGVAATAVPGGVVVSCATRQHSAIDLASGAWHALPRPPVGTRSPVVWTGHELLVLGGGHLLALEPAHR